MIKNLLLSLSTLLILSTACSNTTVNQGDDKKTTEKPTASGKVEFLTYDTFKNKVWNFEANPQEFVYAGELPAIVDFYADWCAPCRKIAPIMEQLAKEYDGKLKIYKINVDKEQQLAAVFQIRSIPSVLFIPQSGQPMMQAGALTEEMYRKVVDEQLVKKNE